MTSGHLFVTGCSSGIGRAVVELALAAGWRVSGCARRAEALAAMGQDHPHTTCLSEADVACDGAVSAAVAAGVTRFGPLDALIANAGQGLVGSLADCSPQALRDLLEVNLVGLHRSVQAVLPHLVHGGRVVLVSSVCGHISLPYMGAYCASKHGVQAYAASLRMEMGHCLRVCTVEPGTVATAFFDHFGADDPTRPLRARRPLDPQWVARVLLKAAASGRPRQSVIPCSARLAAFLAWCWPGLFEAMVRRRLSRAVAAGR